MIWCHTWEVHVKPYNYSFLENYEYLYTLRGRDHGTQKTALLNRAFCLNSNMTHVCCARLQNKYFKQDQWQFSLVSSTKTLYVYLWLFNFILRWLIRVNDFIFCCFNFKKRSLLDLSYYKGRYKNGKQLTLGLMRECHRAEVIALKVC